MLLKKIAIGVVALLLAASSCQEYEGFDSLQTDCPPVQAHPKSSVYKPLLEQFWKKTGSPGVIALVSKPGEATWADAVGYADLEHQVPMTICTQFRTGSITKIFTSVVILQMQTAGKLSLEDPLEKYLPELKGNIPQIDQIKIKHLLNHTSGVADYYYMTNYMFDLMNRPETMDRTPSVVLKRYVYGKKLDFAPGTNWHYSNSGYTLLQWIAEKLDGKPFHQVVKARILDPVGMVDSYMESRTNNRRLARSYVDFAGDGELIDVTKQDDTVWGTGEGGLVSTAHDLNLFMRALFNGNLLTPAARQQMMYLPCSPDAVDEGECGYALGLSYWKDTPAGDSWGHTGGEVGMEAILFYYPEKDAVFCFFRNRNGGSDKQFAFDIVNQ